MGTVTDLGSGCDLAASWAGTEIDRKNSAKRAVKNRIGRLYWVAAWRSPLREDRAPQVVLYNHEFGCGAKEGSKCRPFRRMFGSSGDWDNRRQRLVFDARPDKSERSTSENPVRRAFRRLCLRHTRGPQGSISGAPRPRPSYFSQ